MCVRRGSYAYALGVIGQIVPYSGKWRPIIIIGIDSLREPLKSFPLLARLSIARSTSSNWEENAEGSSRWETELVPATQSKMRLIFGRLEYVEEGSSGIGYLIATEERAVPTKPGEQGLASPEARSTKQTCFLVENVMYSDVFRSRCRCGRG